MINIIKSLTLFLYTIKIYSYSGSYLISNATSINRRLKELNSSIRVFTVYMSNQVRYKKDWLGNLRVVSIKNRDYAEIRKIKYTEN